MKILIVANQNTGKMSPFVVEQMAALRKEGCVVDTYGVVGHGVLGYLKNLPALKEKIKECKPDIVHAHYGLSGLLATLQKDVPVVITYHGSDIHSRGILLELSRVAMRRAAYNVFVTEKLRLIAGYNKDNYCVQACGLNLDEFIVRSREEARAELGWKVGVKKVLFSSSFERTVKNAPLAKAAMDLVPKAELVELKGFNRHQVQLAMNAADCLLLTSLNEGSPTVIKEAMAVGTPIVSVDVGDVSDVTVGTTGCFISKSYNADELAGLIRKALAFEGKTNGRERIIELGLSNDLIAKRLMGIYNLIIAD